MIELREVGGLSGYWEERGKEGEGKGQDIEIKSGLFIISYFSLLFLVWGQKI